MASKNIFSILDSDDEGSPAPVMKEETSKPATKPVVARESVKDRNDNKRGGRGGRGQQGGKPHRREFDRRSGSGRGREASKQGGGSRNWGNEKDETEMNAEAVEQEAHTDGNEVEGEEATEEKAVEEEEEEDNEMTLDEYLAKKKQERSGEKFAEVKLRQVENEFSTACLITKDGKTPDFVEANYEKVYREKTSGRKKQIFEDVGFRAGGQQVYERRPRDGDNNRRGGREGGRGGRGGREGGRGGRESGRGGRGGRGRAPNVSDMRAFPSLG